MNITILLADDHEIVRAGLKNLLLSDSNLTIIGEAVNGKQAVEMAIALQPDVMIMDIGMPVLNGIEATKLIYKSIDKIKIIALSMHVDKHFVIGMFKAGATGYLLKDCAFEELIKAIYIVNKGNYYLSNEINNINISEFSGNLENLKWSNACKVVQEY